MGAIPMGVYFSIGRFRISPAVNRADEFSGRRSMADSNHNEAQVPTGIDARKFERKRIPLKSRLLDINGTTLSDCTIVDLSLVGAQISLPTADSIPERVYVVELTNRVAYEARVAWWRPNAAGLAFQEVYKLDDDMPEQMEFLKEALIEAKLEQVNTLTANGTSLADALQTAGVSGIMYARWNSERAQNNGIAQRLWQLEAENASDRKSTRLNSSH